MCTREWKSEENVRRKEKGGNERRKSSEKDKEKEPFASVDACIPLSIYYTGRVVCVQKGEKERHILYLWVFAATVLSRRRLVAES